MPKLPVVSGKDLVKALSKLGFVIISQKGSHIKMRHSDGRTAISPNHKNIKKGTLKKGTLKKGILNPLNVPVEEFIKILS